MSVTTSQLTLFGQNGTSKSNFAQQLSDFWKDDFAPLQAAGQAILKCLRDDESSSNADLYRRIASNNPGSHYYYPDRTLNFTDAIEGDQTWRNKENMASPIGRYRPPSQVNHERNNFNVTSPFGSASLETAAAPPLLTLKHQRTVPLPPFLVEKLKQVERATFMGLFAPAGLAWMSVDSIVYLWSIRQSSSSSFGFYQMPSKECIVSVGLVRPKKGKENNVT
jgi:Nup133 N terminal like